MGVDRVTCRKRALLNNSQRKGIDYGEIFFPVVKLTSIRILLSIVTSENLHIEQMDVKTTFLHGDLDKEIYMQQPEGFVVPGKEHMVCKITRILYGFKQASRQWYKKFDSFTPRVDSAKLKRICVVTSRNTLIHMSFYSCMWMIC